VKKKKRVKLHEPYSKFMGYLKENNIKLRELSDLLGGTTISTTSMKNNGWADYSMREINKICDAYKISADMFRT